MGEDDQSDDTLSSFQELLIKAVGLAAVNRWSFTVGFRPDGSATLAVDVPPPPPGDPMT